MSNPDNGPIVHYVEDTVTSITRLPYQCRIAIMAGTPARDGRLSLAVVVPGDIQHHQDVVHSAGWHGRTAGTWHRISECPDRPAPVATVPEPAAEPAPEPPGNTAGHTTSFYYGPTLPDTPRGKIIQVLRGGGMALTDAQIAAAANMSWDQVRSVLINMQGADRAVALVNSDPGGPVRWILVHPEKMREAWL